jgi:hypothetical protein
MTTARPNTQDLRPKTQGRSPNPSPLTTPTPRKKEFRNTYYFRVVLLRENPIAPTPIPKTIFRNRHPTELKRQNETALQNLLLQNPSPWFPNSRLGTPPSETPFPSPFGTVPIFVSTKMGLSRLPRWAIGRGRRHQPAPLPSPFTLHPSPFTPRPPPNKTL